jgi:fluoride exporter
MSGADRPALQHAYLAVALGSALGGALRWWLSELLQAAPGQGFPWGTLWVNVSGSLLIGWYAARVAAAHGRRSKLRQLFFMTGFCGGYTTFSIFSLETLLLLQAGHLALAVSYVAASLLLWMGGVWAGWRLGAQGRWGAAR